MKKLDSLNSKIITLKSNFNFKDFFGLSSLIFGLLLSNTSMNKSSANVTDVKTTKHHAEASSASKKEVHNKKNDKKKQAINLYK